MRITILGLPGSGKSTLAKKISQKLGIPHIHIDRFWFKAGGRINATDTEKERIRRIVLKDVTEAISQEEWVSDGLFAYAQTLIAEAADVIVFLDIPAWRLFWNHAVRILNRNARHAEVTLWDDLLFFPEIRKRIKKSKKKIYPILEAHPEKVVTLTSRKEIAEYLRSLA
ncbi:MAG: topology modulation protein [Parcubacteria group bacterium]|nr:topology modulation protein [Parcubacteria group bacterium]